MRTSNGVGSPLAAVPFTCVEVEASDESDASGVSESHAARLLASTADDTRAVIRRDDGFTTRTSVSRNGYPQRNSLTVLGEIAHGKSVITPVTDLKPIHGRSADFRVKYSNSSCAAQ
jgi:hypothetical protein